MRGWAKAAALTAALIVASTFGAGSATAHRSFSVFPGRTIETIDRNFVLEEPRGINIRCELRIQGMFEAFIPKTRGATAGRIDTASARSCVSNIGLLATVIVLIEPRSPWRVLYEGFGGTLPTISSVRFIWQRVGFLITLGSTSCLYGGDLNVTGWGENERTHEFWITRLRTISTLTLVRALREEPFGPCHPTGGVIMNLIGERIEAKFTLI
jgi:hypothetical protein